MKHPCPYCNSQNTFPLVKVTEDVTEHVCDDCGCTFNVTSDPQLVEAE